MKTPFEGSWTAEFLGQQFSLPRENLDRWRRMFVRDPELLARISELFWFDTYCLNEFFGIHPRDIVLSVKELELPGSISRTKPAEPLTGPLLKGLWHKHYFTARFLAKNIQLGLGRNGMRKLILEELPIGATPTEEMVSRLARRVVDEPIASRSAASKMTGEWIIFLPHHGKNYYLCLGKHGTDPLIAERVRELCPRDFPDLIDWWKQAAH